MLTATRDGWATTVAGKPSMKGTAKIDRATNPMQSDVMFSEGDLAGRTLRQITKVEGDVLIGCIGAERPTEFKSKPGSGHTLSVWIRVK